MVQDPTGFTQACPRLRRAPAYAAGVASRRRQAIVVLGGVAAVCAWCGWVSGFHRRTAPALATWLVTLAAVVAVDVLLWQGRHGRRPGWRVEPVAEPWPPPGARGRHPALIGTVPWLALVLIGTAWDVLGLDSGPHQYHLTISALSQAYRPLNAATLLVWIVAGVGYGLARARAPLPHPPRATGANPVLAAAPALLLPPDPLLGVGFWLGLFAAGVALDVVARRTRGRIAAAEQLLRFVTAPLAANVVLVLAWAYAGYHLFAF